MVKSEGIASLGLHASRLARASPYTTPCLIQNIWLSTLDIALNTSPRLNLNHDSAPPPSPKRSILSLR